MSSRTINSAKNLLVGTIGQVLSIFLNFLARTIFIYTLSKEFLGINGLFANVLSILSISELGIGNAIIFSLYKPLAQNNQKLVAAIMNFFQKAYRIIGFVVLVIGLLLLPFLPYLIQGTTELLSVHNIYLLFLFESVSTYWFFAYKSSLLKADQKTYVVSIYEQIISIIKVFVRIICLLLLKDTPIVSFYVYTILGIGFNIVSNIMVSRRVDKSYSYLKEYKTEQVPKEEMTAIKKNVFALFFSKLSAVVNESTDHLIISAFVGVIAEGIYSNYAYITTILNGMVRMFASSISASLGNLNSTESVEKKEEFLRTLHFIYFWIYGFCAICLWELFDTFIRVWAGEDYVLSKVTVMVIVLNFLVYGLMSALTQYQSESGLYWQGRIIPVLSVIVNIILSITFTKYFKWGIAGILGATIISRGLIILPLTAKVVCKNIFNKGTLFYLKLYLKSFFVILFTGGLVEILLLKVPTDNIVALIIRLVVCLVVVNGIWILIYRKTNEWNYIMGIMKRLLKKIKKGKKND